MSLTIEAIYEAGVLKPIQPIELADGTHVSLIITDTLENNSEQSPAEMLAAIASLPLEGAEQGFSNQDHDQLLYGDQP
ncbi:MAG: antitoxin family protein [Cyanobacteria bacterium LVE1205-1]|jgi:predicted DNA-binding antitoxin AbrB/MazE fold protein